MKNYLKKLFEKLQEIKEWRLRRKIIHGRNGLVKRYEHKYQVETILEQWIIKRILDGNTNRRKELAEKQASIKEIKAFVEYLKKQ